LLGCDAGCDVDEALELAKDCEHEDAKWLVSLFPDGPPVNVEEAREVMLAQGEDPRAIFFSAYMHVDEFGERMQDGDVDEVRRAAQLGYAPAQAALVTYFDVDDSFLWAEKAAAQGGSDGLHALASCFYHGIDCEKDESRALLLFKEAAEMESAESQMSYGEFAFTATDWERYWWWGRAARQGCRNSSSGLVLAAVEHLKMLDKSDCRRVIFEIGAACKGHIIKKRKTEFVFGWDFEPEEIDAVRRAVALYDQWCEDTKRTIFCWIWIGRQKRVAKDIRGIICKMLWANRAAWCERPLERRSTRKKVKK
jgi:hypothetical protein